MIAKLLPILVTFQMLAAQEDSCFNAPSQSRVGYCINIHSCPPVLMLLKQKPLRPETITQLQASQCGFDGTTPKVCCPNNAQPVTPPTNRPPPVTSAPNRPNSTPSRPQQSSTQGPNGNQTPVRVGLNHPKLRLLPIDSCGVNAFDDKIVNGKRAGLAQFPWMARIGYLTRSGESYRCGGSVISKRYVLTAAHCISNLPQSLRLQSVLLGETDSLTEPDCEEKQGFQVCMPNTQKFNIERVIPHPQYSPSIVHNDIGLIRLDRDADLSVDSVRAICLPVGRIQLKNLDSVANLTVAGWGTTENGTSSTFLQYVYVPAVPNDRCKTIYQRQATIVPSQVCAGGASQDSCDGDSGGPMTMPDEVGNDREFRQTQVGIVSFGPVRCASAGQPGVYTRVGHYMGWIMDNIEP